jgi:hypothetical protein
VHEGDDLRIELCMREMIFVLKWIYDAWLSYMYYIHFE